MAVYKYKLTCNQSGEILGSNKADPPVEQTAGDYEYVSNDPALEDAHLHPNNYKAVLDGYVVLSIEAKPAVPTYYLHIKISGGDGEYNPIGLLNNDGASAEGILAIAISLRNGPLVDDPVLSNVGSVGSPAMFRIAVRDDIGQELPLGGRVKLVEGLASFNVTTTMGPTNAWLKQEDYDELPYGADVFGLKLVLVNGSDEVLSVGEDIALKVFRDLN